MADQLRKERLQPSLLDRLTDDQPEQIQESRETRVLSPARLRECVRRDLAWLLNTTHLQVLEPLEHHDEVARSVLNYGMPDMAGRTASSFDRVAMEQALRQVILAFEPRLVGTTIKIKAYLDDQRMNRNSLTFDIEAELWAQPLPLRLFLRTAIDLENGTAEVIDRDAVGAT
jgi:type VI secretion system protein ImpF